VSARSSRSRPSASHPRADLIAARQRPVKRGAEVVVIPGKRGQRGLPFGQVEESARVPLPGRLGAARLGQPVRCGRAYGVKEPVASPVLGGLGDNKRLAGEPVAAPARWPPNLPTPCERHLWARSRAI